MNEIADGVWHVAGPDFALPLGARMPLAATVVRLGDGSLLVYAPADFTPDAARAIDDRGSVAHVVAPNLYHHTFVTAAMARWPRAQLWRPQGLATKRRDLPTGRDLAELGPVVADTLDTLHVAGAPAMDEYVLFHRASGTLVCADFVFNIAARAPANTMSRLAFALTGVGGGRLARSRGWTVVTKDKAALSASVARICALPIRRLSPAHGAPVDVTGDRLAAVWARRATTAS